MRDSLRKLGKELRVHFPHGHQDFITLCLDDMDLHNRKNHDYARGGHPLSNFFRRADFYKNYPGLDLGDPAVVALVDAMKQIDAALWMKCKGYEGDVEPIDKRLGDADIYIKLARLIEAEKKHGQTAEGRRDQEGGVQRTTS